MGLSVNVAIASLMPAVREHAAGWPPPIGTMRPTLPRALPINHHQIDLCSPPIFTMMIYFFFKRKVPIRFQLADPTPGVRGLRGLLRVWGLAREVVTGEAVVGRCFDSAWDRLVVFQLGCTIVSYHPEWSTLLPPTTKHHPTRAWGSQSSRAVQGLARRGRMGGAGPAAAGDVAPWPGRARIATRQSVMRA